MKQDFISFPLHLIVHPFDGFWDMKYDGRGKLRVAFALLALVVIATVLQRQYSGFLVNFNDLRYLNSINDLLTIVIPFFLWCTANWSITTLMEGEGKFKEIVMATGYSMLPIILVSLPMTLASRFMVVEETAFYYVMITISSVWFAWLLFVGTMTVHQYTALKTVWTMALTVIAMGIIVFLAALLFSMLQQIYDFAVNIYRELIFRA